MTLLAATDPPMITAQAPDTGRIAIQPGKGVSPWMMKHEAIIRATPPIINRLPTVRGI